MIKLRDASPPSRRLTAPYALAAVALSALLMTSQRPAAAAGPAPSAVPPNASRVTATVLSHKVWAPGSLENVRPLISPECTLHSLQLKILTSAPADDTSAHLSAAGSTIDAFSAAEIAPETVGKNIAATLTLTGTTDGVRWLIKDFQLLP